MKTELLTKFNEIKLFLFDLEGVLLGKDSSIKQENNQPDWSFIKSACTEFEKFGTRFGIVTAADFHLDSNYNSHQGCIILSASINKVSLVDELLKDLAIDYKDVFYIGDDLLDIPLLQKCAISAVPRDGRREVKRVVSFIAQSSSGNVLSEIIGYLKQSKSGI
jgi:3-deoxy-D-manno-octulosonate 8-phosphate phosphatase (KDO 8-P phosphatase)